MIDFTLWAPKAERVDLLLRTPDDRHAMQRVGGGTWRCSADAAAGDRYAFSLDGGPPRPDPRSMFQPEGVHGFSQLVDHDEYAWRTPTFRARPLSSAIIYEMHVGTFTDAGTLDSAIDGLDHLAELGVTHVELLPLNAFHGEFGWGYDGVAWYAPHAAYTGADGPDAVKRFVDAAHERDLAVVLDVVYNHLGPSGNYLAEFGPYFSDTYNTPWGPALNLDGAHSDHVRRYIVDNALMWLRDYRFDALRLDAIHAFFDRSAVHLLEQMRREVDLLQSRSGRPLALIAESDLNDPRVVTPREAGGFGCDAQWSDDFHHALHALVTGERDGYYKDFGEVASLAKSLANAFVRDGGFDHPRQRSHGRPPRGLTTDRFLSYIQNHDQIGNRAQGDRISASLDVETVKACAAVVLLSPFVPMLFQGEEWAASTPFQFFADHRHNGLADAVRDGRRAEFASFGWTPDQVPDPVAPETFKRSKLAWKEATESPNADVLDWHKRLIELRRTRSMSARSLEATRVVFDEERCWLAFRNADVIVACVFGEDPSARRGVGASDRHSAAGEESQRVTLAALLDAHETIDATPLLAAGSASVSVSDRHVHLSRPGCAVLGVALRGPS